MAEKDPKHVEDAGTTEVFKDDSTPPSNHAVDISGVNKAKVLRKMDLRIIPIVTVLYLFSFLDRGYASQPNPMAPSSNLLTLRAL